MQFKVPSSPLPIKEIIFQIILNTTVFIFYAFDRRLPGIQYHQFFFYLNFAIAGLIINYLLLPRFLYKNRYLEFTMYTLVVIALTIFVEEAILEQIFYPDTRGRRFLGVFFSLLSTMPTITILVGFKFAWDALKRQHEVQELRNSVRESELQFLKSQINPHFLFNNMNNLYSYAVAQSPRTPSIILELSDVLRYMLYECKAKFVPLTKEVEQLENYINLSKLQIEGRGTVSITSTNVSSSYSIAPLILVVFVENAFKHSSSSLIDKIAIDINIYVSHDGLLEFSCKNTFHAQSNTKSLDQGIGLKNVKKRLALIYPNAHTLDINASSENYRVDLSIKLNKIEEK